MIHSRRNTRRLLAEGGHEVGTGHYPLIVGLHAAWLLALLLLVPSEAPVNWPLLALFLALQAARLWVLASLGRFWTTRIVILPGAPLPLWPMPNGWQFWPMPNGWQCPGASTMLQHRFRPHSLHWRPSSPLRNINNFPDGL